MNAASSPVDRLKAWSRRTWVRRTGIGLATFLVIFGLLGYFWLPGFAKAKLETALSEAFHRPVSVERIDISPYTLAATVQGFKVGDVFSVERLHVRVSPTSLVRAIPVVAEVSVTGPSLHLVREAPGRLNISDLIAEWTSTPEKKESGPPPEFSVSNIRLDGGRIEWADRVTGETQTVSEIALGIPFVANVPSSVDVFVEPHFAARINGAPLALAGKVKPFAAGRDAAIDLSLDDLDLTRLDEYAPTPLPVKLDSAKLGFDLNIRFSRAGEGDSALTVSGDIRLRQLALRALGGKAAVTVPGMTLQGLEADVFHQRITLKALVLEGDKAPGLSVGRVGDKRAFLKLDQLRAEALQADLPAHSASLGRLLLAKPDVTLRRTTDGRLDVLALLGDGGKSAAPATSAAQQPRNQTKPAAPTSGGTSSKATQANPAWAWALGKFELTSGQIAFADDALPKTLPLTLTGLEVTVDGLDSRKPAPAPVRLRTAVNERGRIAVDGKAGLDGSADLALDLQKVELVALQGWAADHLNALLTQGDISFTGHARMADGKTALDGNLELGNFNVLDAANAEDLLRWKSLRLGNLAVKTAPLSVRIGDVSLSNFYAKVLITPEGRVNLKDLAKSPSPAGESSPAATANPASPSAGSNSGTNPGAGGKADASPAPVADSSPPPDIRVGRIQLTNGRVNFTDKFIKPNYSANLTDLNGRIGALSTGTLSDVELRGKVDRSAPLEITGRMDPLSKPIGLDIQAKARGIDMSSFSAYSSRYVGYTIEKGKLSVDVHYKVDKGELVADNNVFLDQLTFGKKVESPDALSVPVTLAVALLKNSRGEIDINLPIRGSLNDPQFSIGGIVVKVIVNLIVKAVTSPFALLGSLFGGGEDLSNVAFPVGVASLTPEVEGRLKTLAKAMADRPALTLEVTGVADPQADAEGLKRETLNRRVRAQKVAEMAKKGKEAGSVDDATVTAEEYPVYLERVYKDADIKKPRNIVGLAKSLPVAEMEALLLDSIPAGDAEMKALAERRGHRVQTWLTDKANVPIERVFLMGPKVELANKAGAGKDVPGSRVEFSLR